MRGRVTSLQAEHRSVYSAGRGGGRTDSVRLTHNPRTSPVEVPAGLRPEGRPLPPRDSAGDVSKQKTAPSSRTDDGAVALSQLGERSRSWRTHITPLRAPATAMGCRSCMAAPDEGEGTAVASSAHLLARRRAALEPVRARHDRRTRRARGLLEPLGSDGVPGGRPAVVVVHMPTARVIRRSRAPRLAVGVQESAVAGGPVPRLGGLCSPRLQ